MAAGECQTHSQLNLRNTSVLDGKAESSLTQNQGRSSITANQSAKNSTANLTLSPIVMEMDNNSALEDDFSFQNCNFPIFPSLLRLPGNSILYIDKHQPSTVTKYW